MNPHGVYVAGRHYWIQPDWEKEFEKCKNSPSYWMENYLTVINRETGERQPLKLREWDKKVIDKAHELGVQPYYLTSGRGSTRHWVENPVVVEAINREKWENVEGFSLGHIEPIDIKINEE